MKTMCAQYSKKPRDMCTMAPLQNRSHISISYDLHALMGCRAAQMVMRLGVGQSRFCVRAYDTLHS